MPQYTVVDDEGNPKKYTAVDDEGNPKTSMLVDDSGDPIMIPEPPPLGSLEPKKLSGRVKTIDPFEGAKNTASRLFFGATDENDPEKKYPRVRGGEWLQIPGVQEAGRYLANKIDDPMQRGAEQDWTDIAKNYAAGAVEGAAGLLAGSADPRAVGLKTPSSLLNSRFSQARNVTPGKPVQRRIEGPIGYDGQSAIRRGTPNIPPPTRMSPRRFLGSGGGAIEVSNPLTGLPLSLESEAILGPPEVPGSREGLPFRDVETTEFDKPANIDRKFTRRYYDKRSPALLNEGLPPYGALPPEGILNQEPPPVPPAPLGPSRLGMQGGQGSRFGRRPEGEQPILPMLPEGEYGVPPARAFEQPPAAIAPPSSPIEEVLALSKTGQKPVIKSRTELDGTTRVWVNDNEYTHLFGLGGATAQDIKQLHFAANDPKTFIRMEELKRQNEVGTPYGPVTKFEAERQAQVPRGLIDPNRPGESQFGSRGNIAIFGPSTNRQVYEIADELASVLTKGIEDDPNVEKLLQEAEVAITQERDPAIIDDNLEQIKGYLGTAKSPDERELFGGLYDTAREKVAQSQATPGAVVRPRFKNLPKKSRFKETKLAERPKPTLRFTQDGSLIDTNTGEVMDIGQAIQKTSEAEPKPDTTSIIKPISDDKLPQGMAKVGKDKIAIGYDESLGQILATSLYQGNTGKIIVKELLQNSMDATRSLGTGADIHITLDELANAITVKDNGPGMTREELETYFTNLGSSGKRDDITAIGGFGLAKAAPLLGGTNVHVVSVAKRSNGKTYKTIFTGTPKDLLNAKVGVDLTSVQVPEGTPTGLSVTTTMRMPQQSYNKLTTWQIQDSMEKLASHSLGFEGTISVDGIDAYNTSGIPKNKKQYGGLLSDPNDKVVKLSNQSADFDLIVPVGAQYAERVGVQIALLNNGMYQNTVNLGGYGTYPGIPDKILLNIKSKVPEGHNDYPFTANRENLRGTVMEDIQKYINENIVKPGVNARINALSQAYQNMIPTPYPVRSGRAFHFYDVGNSLSPDDLNFFIDHPINAKIAEIMSKAIETIMVRMPQDWQDKLEKIGFITHDELYGIHIPNPAATASTGGEKSAILLNPWQRLAKAENDTYGTGDPPIDSAIAGLFHTIAHEIAHIPGGGHDESFAQRLAQVYSKVGADLAIDYQRQFGEILSDPLDPGHYAPEVSEILQRYNDTRRTIDTSKDPLYGTGISHAASREGSGGNALYRKSNRAGAARNIWDETGALGGAQPPRTPRSDRVSNVPPRRTPPSEPSAPVDSAIKERLIGEGSLVGDIASLSRGLVATGDLAPLLRQGGSYAGRAFWRKAAIQQFKSYASEGGHQRALDELRRHELMQKQANGKTEAEEMGLRLNVGQRGWSHQEETMMGVEHAERLAEWALRGKINPVKASNRAFHDSVDIIRLGAAAELKDNYRRFYESVMRTARTEGDRRYAAAMNPASPVVKKKIGELVNSASGSPSLDIKERRIPKDIRVPFTRRWVNVPKSIADKEVMFHVPLDRFAGILNFGIFSGRLAKSYIERYNRLLNPYSWMKADPVMRREYLKQLLSIGGARVVLTGLGAAMGGLLGTKMTSTDWGKSVITANDGWQVGMDTTLGGGKYETFAARMLQGEYTTRKGETKGLGEGPFIPTGLDLVEGLGEGLASPAFRAAIEILKKSEHFAGPQAKGQEVGLRTMTDTMTPIIGQDIWDIVTEHPEYIPLLFPDAVGNALTIRRVE